MTDRPASWRMPSPKMMDKMAAEAAVGRNAPPSDPVGPADAMPPEYWNAVLDDASADARPTGDPVWKQKLADIQRHLLRVACHRCGRTVEIQKIDAVRLYGPESLWKDVGQRLLDDTCQQRTGRHVEDGCWPSYE
ncbi:hypothetical protein [Bradyrhizobium sp. BR 1432]|uniref:hypothetical protein n=1 Tax=Bradyrhizobium sp. BR 1432 TaxID=3447966 RepID=UPI003EE72BBA